MDPHSSSRELEQYVDGHLSAEDSTAVRAHLEGCKLCQLRLADIALEGQWKGPERRGEPRIPVKFPGRLKLLDPLTSVGPPHDVEVPTRKILRPRGDSVTNDGESLGIW